MTRLDPERWLDRYGDLLYRYALMRVKDEAVAEDLVQETLLAAWRGRERFAGQSSESTWLIGILKHKIVDYFRRTKTVSLESQDLDLERWFDDRGHWRRPLQPLEELDRDRLLQAIRYCVERLPPRFRQLFLLREVEGLSAGEICRQLPASSTNNVWVMLSRMRFRLRACLEQQGYGRETA
ncbi:MAG TPA: sigma-70 family RNA polymerase sigma factor [Methylothermaceae bacterium]|nr:sigma-70 family RNA polymerase sigma factor [Methylothermaceae bacterium]